VSYQIMLIPFAEDNSRECDGGSRELYRFIRKRSQGRLSSYGMTVVKEAPGGQKVEVCFMILRYVSPTVSPPHVDSL
jgi:hypothetical protein